MASGSKIDDLTATSNLFSAVVTLTLTPLPTLPVDIILEILCRLPVKLLLQLRCVCKLWNSLISDSEFIKKHLLMSTTRRLHFLSYLGALYYPYNKYIFTSYPLDSVFTDLNTDFTQFEYSPNNFKGDYPRIRFNRFIGSCNGILCFADDFIGRVILWNPSIRKFKELPLFTKPNSESAYHIKMNFGFGYDSSTDKYKVVLVLAYTSEDDNVRKTEVKVHTLGTNIWRSIPPYPFGFPIPAKESGKYVSGTINWLVFEDKDKAWGRALFILSFDLVNESYQKILPRIDGKDMCDFWSIGVLGDCLCVRSDNDVWIMKEYGNKESWTKLFTIPYYPGGVVSNMPIYISENGQAILKFFGNFDLIVGYDSNSGTLKPTNFQGFPEVYVQNLIPEVYVESLISPCSLH